MSSVGKMYFVCERLNNALTCLYGNETPESFGPDHPFIAVLFQVN